MSRYRRLREEQRGTTVVESAIIIMVFLMLLFGVMEASRALSAHHYLSSIAREAARFAIVRGGDSGRAVSSTDVENYVKGRAYGMDPTKFTVTTTWDPDNSPGSAVSIAVQYDFVSIVPFIPAFTMSSASKMTVQY